MNPPDKNGTKGLILKIYFFRGWSNGMQIIRKMKNYFETCHKEYKNSGNWNLLDNI